MAERFLRRFWSRITGASAPGAPLDGRAWHWAETPGGRAEAARWAYRTILLREPDSHDALDHLARTSHNPKSMRDALLQSAEARAQPGFPVFFAMSGDEPAQPVQVEVTPAQRDALFARTQAVWKALGETQAHWSVATNDEFRPENIGRSLETFYATGQANVATLMRTLARNGIEPKALRTCMDFGCGVGRLTAALAGHFESVAAVDVSPSHLAIAREALPARGATNVTIHQLESIAGIEALPRCGLVFSLIVLQHNPPPVMRALFSGLLGRIAPGGAGVIQVPTYLPKGYAFDVERYLAQGEHEMEMHALPQSEAFRAAREAGVEIVEVLEDAWIGYGVGSRSNTFVLRRPA